MIKGLAIILAVILFPALQSSADTVYFKKNSEPKYYQTYDDVGDGYIRIIVDGRSSNYRKKSIYKIEKNDRVENSYPPNEQALNQPQPIEKPQPKSPVIQQPKTNNPVALLSAAKVKADVKKALAERHPGNYSGQKILYDSNMESYWYLATLPGDKITNEILTNLLSRHYPNFTGIKILYESNIKSYKALNMDN